MAEQLGDGLLGVMREIKASFDPHNLFNPGKVVPDGRFKIDTDLRQGAGHELKLPFTPVLAFAAKDGSFTRNLEQCNGCGGCRKETPTMCPTFIATGEEIMSTRGRANAIRAALELRGVTSGDPLRCAELEAALSNCLSCKACTTECPSNVNLALLKAELLHARIRRDGLSWRERLVSSVDFLGGSAAACPGWPTLHWARSSCAAFCRRCWAWPGSGRCRTTPGSGSTAGSRAGSARRWRRAGGWCSGTTPLCAITSPTSASRR